MTDLPPPELFSERPVRSDFVRVGTGRKRRTLTVVVALAILAFGLYYKFGGSHAPTEIPTIKAEGAFKQKPQQPGGIDIPNQDVLAYQQLDNSVQKQSGVEHLLPPPETPQPVANNAPTENASANVSGAPAIETLNAPPPLPIATTVSKEKPAPVVETTKTAPTPVAAPVATVEKKEVAQIEEPPATTVQPAPIVVAPKPAATPAPAATKTTASKLASGKADFRIQLASFPDEVTAKHEIGKIQAKYATALGTAKLHLTRADLGAKGIYYRVQSNPLTESTARDVCAAIKKASGGCILVRP